MVMPEQNKLTKKKTIWIVILLGLCILFQLYLLFDVKDWSHHWFEVVFYFFNILCIAYLIYYYIKKYKSTHQE